MEIIRLGLVCKRLYALALDRLKDKLEIVAVCDKDTAKAKSIAQSLGFEPDFAYGDYNKILTCPDIEAVKSLVPICVNFEKVATVIRSGKHLVVEKPFASTPEANHELIRLRDKANVKVMVTENMRYEKQNIFIESLITSRQIGNPFYFIGNHIVEYRQKSESGGFGQTKWRQNPKFEGGVIIDSEVHHVARIWYLFGDAIGVFAQGDLQGLASRHIRA